jgi:hypothetical protein
MRARSLRQARCLARLPTPTDDDLRAWEEQERRQRDRTAPAVDRSIGSREGSAEGGPAAPASAGKGGPAGGLLAGGGGRTPRSTRSTAESFNREELESGPEPSSRSAVESSRGAASSGASSGPAPPARPSCRRPAGVPRLALVAHAAGARACGMRPARAAEAVAAGGAGEQAPLGSDDRVTLEALLTGRLIRCRGGAQQPGPAGSHLSTHITRAGRGSDAGPRASTRATPSSPGSDGYYKVSSSGSRPQARCSGLTAAASNSGGGDGRDSLSLAGVCSWTRSAGGGSGCGGALLQSTTLPCSCQEPRAHSCGCGGGGGGSRLGTHFCSSSSGGGGGVSAVRGSKGGCNCGGVFLADAYGSGSWAVGERPREATPWPQECWQQLGQTAHPTQASQQAPSGPLQSALQVLCTGGACASAPASGSCGGVRGSGIGGGGLWRSSDGDSGRAGVVFVPVPVVDWGSGRRLEQDAPALAQLVGALEATPAAGGSWVPGSHGSCQPAQCGGSARGARGSPSRAAAAGAVARGAAAAGAQGQGRRVAAGAGSGVGSARGRRAAELAGGFAGPLSFKLTPRRARG